MQKAVLACCPISPNSTGSPTAIERWAVQWFPVAGIQSKQLYRRLSVTFQALKCLVQFSDSQIDAKRRWWFEGSIFKIRPWSNSRGSPRRKYVAHWLLISRSSQCQTPGVIGAHTKHLQILSEEIGAFLLVFKFTKHAICFHNLLSGRRQRRRQRPRLHRLHRLHRLRLRAQWRSCVFEACVWRGKDERICFGKAQGWQRAAIVKILISFNVGCFLGHVIQNWWPTDFFCFAMLHRPRQRSNFVQNKQVLGRLLGMDAKETADSKAEPEPPAEPAPPKLPMPALPPKPPVIAESRALEAENINWTFKCGASIPGHWICMA